MQALLLYLQLQRTVLFTLKVIMTGYGINTCICILLQ